MSDFHRTVVEELISKLDKYYVFPNMTERIASKLTMALNAETYDHLLEPREFASVLSNDLFEVSQDRHLRVRYNPGITDDSDADITLTPELLEQIRSDNEFENFGFYQVERLDGNIGYIDLRAFAPTEIAGDTAVAAMNFVANTYSLIIDLRKNHGGVPSMIDLICGYLFRPSVHLNSLHWRKDDAVEQYWSLPYVPGKHYGGKPVYVLTSKETFSGAEEFAYVLKQRKRATIVGEKTKGGANPGMVIRITSDFGAFIPMGRAVHPLTGTSWEGVGVQPDIDVPGEDALTHAYTRALNYIAETPSFVEPVRHEAKQKLAEFI